MVCTDICLALNNFSLSPLFWPLWKGLQRATDESHAPKPEGWTVCSVGSARQMECSRKLLVMLERRFRDTCDTTRRATGRVKGSVFS